MKKYLKKDYSNRMHDNICYRDIKEGVYTTNNSDLKIIIHKIIYKTEDYFKAVYSLVNKNNGILYDNRKKNKFYKKLIGHWTALK